MAFVVFANPRPGRTGNSNRTEAKEVRKIVIRRMRTHGMTFAQIGTALGVTRQRVHQLMTEKGVITRSHINSR